MRQTKEEKQGGLGGAERMGKRASLIWSAEQNNH